jgi:hypothetical protein
MSNTFTNKVALSMMLPWVCREGVKNAGGLDKTNISIGNGGDL